MIRWSIKLKGEAVLVLVALGCGSVSGVACRGCPAACVLFVCQALHLFEVEVQYREAHVVPKVGLRSEGV